MFAREYLKELVPLCAGLLFSACPQSGDVLYRNDGGEEIYDRFTTKEILPSSALPERMTRLKFFPNSREFLALGQGGEVFHLVLEEDSARLLGSFTVPDVAPGLVELGLTDAAFDPQFQANGHVYFCFSTGDNRWNRIVRMQWSNNYAAIVNSSTIMLNIDRIAPVNAFHGIYALAFAADGSLYATIGDATQSQFAQDPGSLLGKLIRIMPTDAGGYSIPADNPYLDDDRVRGEIAAFGLRSPFRLLVWGDKILIGDVGANRFEEIDFYEAGRTNFGWPECEGVCDRSEFQNPILAIGHNDPAYQLEDPEPAGDLRHAIALGVVYDGAGDDPYQNLLDSRLLFNDVFLGYVRAARISAAGELSDNKHIFHKFAVTSMDTGPDGYIYGSTIYSSQVFRVELKAP
ncbi:MAG: PQQ-dependent sugar dehydrogenase [bacterium]